MKCNVYIGTETEERVDVYARSRTPLVERIEALTEGTETRLVGFVGDETVVLDWAQVQRIYVEEGKTYASTNDGVYWVKRRLYQMEELAGDDYVKINQSSLVRVSSVRKFEASWGGALRVVLANGDSDYVSRRQTKAVTARFNINRR